MAPIPLFREKANSCPRWTTAACLRDMGGVDLGGIRPDYGCDVFGSFSRSIRSRLRHDVRHAFRCSFCLGFLCGFSCRLRPQIWPGFQHVFH